MIYKRVGPTEKKFENLSSGSQQWQKFNFGQADTISTTLYKHVVCLN